MTGRPAFVLLEDGTWYAGTAPFPIAPGFGELVFTTGLSGYQETFTDPSFMGQIVVMTAPMIGNYGVNDEDMESGKPQVAGVVVRELAKRPSNWRSTKALGDWLAEHQVPVIEGVDTRQLTRHLRERGAMRGVIAEGNEPNAALTRELLASPSMDGLDLATQAGAKVRETVGKGPRVVAYDFGMKRNIVRMLADHGCEVVVVPPTTTAAEVRALEPRGLFLSNGPGDPAAITYASKNIRELAQSGIPTFGICLGHQLLGLAFGGRTTKLLYGHRGGNHPVKDLRSGEVLITSQNHGFAVEGEKEGVNIPGAPDLEVTHRNLNDGSVEGLRHKKLPVFAVQYHPEAAPGPHDAFPHFGEFLRSMGVEVPPRGLATP